MASSSIPSFVRLTPFGPYCWECNTTLSLEKGVTCHAKEFHPKECSFRNAVVVRSIKDELKSLRERHRDDYSCFLECHSVPESLWFCSVCFLSFGRNANYLRHLQSRNGYCSTSTGGRMDLYPTICGRKGPRSLVLVPNVQPPADGMPSVVNVSSTVSSLTFSHLSQLFPQEVVSQEVPAPLLQTPKELSDYLSPFLRPDEDGPTISMLYSPILGPAFEGMMREYVTYSKPMPDEPVALTKWIEAGTTWLNDYAAAHIANVSGNVRSRLAEFEQKELDDEVVRTRTFTLRRGITRLVRELSSFLRFLFRYPTTSFDYYKNIESNEKDVLWMIKYAIVPKILFAAMAEEPLHHGGLPVACHYGLSCGFALKPCGSLVMNECGWFSSRLSTLMHLLRAGVCGYLVTLSVQNVPGVAGNLTAKELDIVRIIQNGRVTNMLAPYVKRLRDMNGRKPPSKDHTVNANGDITCGSSTFAQSIWSTIIPRVVSIAKDLFSELFENNDWELFLTNPIMVLDWVQMDTYVQDDDRQLFLLDLCVKEYSFHNQRFFRRLCSIAQLCLFGLGAGAVRFEELARLKTTSCQWHNSYMYYWSESLKKGSMRALPTPKIVEHRLSLSLSRVFLLIRKCLRDVPRECPSDLLPESDRSHMLSLVQDIFDLDFAPKLLQVRHLFTSIGNIIMPEGASLGGDERLVSSHVLTEKSGHTQGTGRRAYSTVLENSEEALYDFYHKELGEACLDPPVIHFVPFPESILKSALKEILGKKGTFRNSQQRDMVITASNDVLRHAFAGLPCGHGKSMSWMVPIVASFLAGRHVGMRIVIVPYRFLLGHLVERARSQLGLLHDRLTVEFLSSNDIEDAVVPSLLLDHALPALLFLNLDSAIKILQRHMDRLQKLASDNLLKRIYVDECQQLIAEFGFRDAYHGLRDLGRVGVPVLCLSGSLPTSLSHSLMSFCRLKVHTGPDSVQVIEGLEPVGEGFTLNVRVTDDIEIDVVEYIIQTKRIPCHVICSSKKCVAKISQRLCGSFRVCHVTGNSTCDEQFSVSKKWYDGECDILVSTTVALVGNENPKCKTIVIAGFLYDVSSIVQAFGRLRPEQRGDDSVVVIYRNRISEMNYEETKKDGEEAFQKLKAAGCLSDNERTVFGRIFSPFGLRQVLLLRKGCYLQTISSYFGYNRAPCGRCNLCRASVAIERKSCVTSNEDRLDAVLSGSNASPAKRLKVPSPIKERSVVKGVVSFFGVCASPAKRLKVAAPISDSGVIKNKIVAESMNDHDKKTRKLATLVVGELQYRCIVCDSGTCQGELCVKGCYKCGENNHFSSQCEYTIDRLKKILSNKGVCFGCFDVCPRGTPPHDMKSCPLHRRLKRLVQVDYQKHKPLSFGDYLQRLYATDLTFQKMLSTYSHLINVGRYVAMKSFDEVRVNGRLIYANNGYSVHIQENIERL